MKFKDFVTFKSLQLSYKAYNKMLHEEIFYYKKVNIILDVNTLFVPISSKNI